MDYRARILNQISINKNKAVEFQANLSKTRGLFAPQPRTQALSGDVLINNINKQVKRGNLKKSSARKLLNSTGVSKWENSNALDVLAGLGPIGKGVSSILYKIRDFFLGIFDKIPVINIITKRFSKLSF